MPRFAIFDPSALPTASAGTFSIDATAEMSISGAEVAKPTMTSPINTGETPRFRAVAPAHMTSRSAPQKSSSRPTRIAATDNIMS